MTPLFAFLSVPTMIVLGIIGVLIFGRRLPELAKSMGKSIIEFKKGMHGLENGFDDIANPNASTASAPASAPAEAIRPPQRIAPSAPKFDEAPAAPVNTQITANPPQP
jgi:sec-independent protein translocase protein TatA